MKSNVNRLAGVAVRSVLAFALLFSQGVWAAQDQKVTKDNADSARTAGVQQVQQRQTPVAPAKAQGEAGPSAAEEPAVTEQKSSADGSHQAIKVHGHWTIEVRNPDGSLATRRDFENSLTAGGGAYVLSTLLGRTNLIGQWGIDLRGGTAGPCPGSVNNTLGDCIIEESGGPITGSGVFQTLTIAPVSNASGIYSLQLSGNVTATATTQISAVQTFLNVCPGGGPSCPATTTIGLGYLFSQAILSTGINVSSGQVIQVTVVFSFS